MVAQCRVQLCLAGEQVHPSPVDSAGNLDSPPPGENFLNRRYRCDEPPSKTWDRTASLRQTRFEVGGVRPCIDPNTKPYITTASDADDRALLQSEFLAEGLTEAVGWG
jgi:hypothetical protein